MLRRGDSKLHKGMDISNVNCHDRSIGHKFKIRHDNKKSARYIKEKSLITGSSRPVHIGLKNDIPMCVLQQKISELLDAQRSRTNSKAKMSPNDSRSMDKPKREKNQISINHRRQTSTRTADHIYSSHEHDNMIFDGEAIGKVRHNRTYTISHRSVMPASRGIRHGRRNAVVQSDSLIIDSLPRRSMAKDLGCESNLRSEAKMGKGSNIGVNVAFSRDKCLILMQGARGSPVIAVSNGGSRKTLTEVNASNDSESACMKHCDSSETLKKYGNTKRYKPPDQMTVQFMKEIPSYEYSASTPKKEEGEPAHIQVDLTESTSKILDQDVAEAKALDPDQDYSKSPLFPLGGMQIVRIVHISDNLRDHLSYPIQKPIKKHKKAPPKLSRDSIREFMDDHSLMLSSFQSNRFSTPNRTPLSGLFADGGLLTPETALQWHTGTEAISIDKLIHTFVLNKSPPLVAQNWYSLSIDMFSMVKPMVASITQRIFNRREKEGFLSPQFEKDEKTSFNKPPLSLHNVPSEIDSGYLSPPKTEVKIDENILYAKTNLGFARYSPNKKTCPDSAYLKIRTRSSAGSTGGNQTPTRLGGMKSKGAASGNKFTALRGVGKLSGLISGSDKCSPIKTLSGKQASFCYSQALNNESKLLRNNQLKLPEPMCVFKQYPGVLGFSATTFNGISKSYNDDRITILMNAQQKFERLQVKNLKFCNYFGLYGGHGGSECSEYVKERLHKVLLDRVDGNSLGPSIQESFATVDRELLLQSVKTHQNDTSGCSVVGSLVTGTIILARYEVRSL